MHADSLPLFTSIEYNPLDEVRRYCANESPEEQALFEEEQRGRYCEPGDGVRGLPTGNQFNALAYRLLALNPDVRSSRLTLAGFFFY